ncbi:hypothetical protein SAMN05421636_1092 [Pricia antarctica]|uniref:Uncharacterized protein n=1 Tax=Pricia antarctica TaxID=641691 RepID=A0A1G7H4X3_9FLAO|nr:hypothetical protein SAMN05421636_1092 [Pricia antarctica]
MGQVEENDAEWVYGISFEFQPFHIKRYEVFLHEVKRRKGIARG